jgi:hypothetical protein
MPNDTDAVTAQLGSHLKHAAAACRLQVYWRRFDKWLPAKVVAVKERSLVLRYPTGEQNELSLPAAANLRFRAPVPGSG